MPPGVLEVMSGPNTAVSATTAQMAVIASDGHTPVRRSQDCARRSVAGVPRTAVIVSPFSFATVLVGPGRPDVLSQTAGASAFT